MISIGILDVYIVQFRYDTSGPGGIDSYTHVNWYETYVQTNERGYWAPSLAEHEEPMPRSGTLIAVIGDSFTWGQGIRGRERRFSEQLEMLLIARDGRSVKVLNYGVGGTGTLLQIRQVLPDVERIKPDVVLIGYLTNDIEDEVGLVQVEYDPVPFVAKPLGRALPLANFLYWSFIASSGTQAERSFYAWITAYRDPNNYASHLAHLRTMIERIETIFVERPHLLS